MFSTVTNIQKALQRLMIFSTCRALILAHTQLQKALLIWKEKNGMLLFGSLVDRIFQITGIQGRNKGYVYNKRESWRKKGLETVTRRTESRSCPSFLGRRKFSQRAKSPELRCMKFPLFSLSGNFSASMRGVSFLFRQTTLRKREAICG